MVEMVEIEKPMPIPFIMYAAEFVDLHYMGLSVSTSTSMTVEFLSASKMWPARGWLLGAHHYYSVCRLARAEFSSSSRFMVL